MKFKRRNLMALADLICGNSSPDETSYFLYRSSSYLTEFFEDIGTEHHHDGSTRNWWVADVLTELLEGPSQGPNSPPEFFARAIDRLMDPADCFNEGRERPKALQELNDVLGREGFEAFRADDGHCYLRHIGTSVITSPAALSPHRPWTPAEVRRREALASFLDRVSEDELIEEVLLPLFRQLGFHRITAAGHRDKALEYGKDVWMKFVLPTQNVLYFGIQAKKGKLDAAGATRAENANIAEIHNQALMMLGHEVFDPELNRRVLVDHAFIIAGGQITKAARNWLGNELDASRRSQIMFLDRDDILNLFVANNVELPAGALPPPNLGPFPEEPPF